MNNSAIAVAKKTFNTVPLVATDTVVLHRQRTLRRCEDASRTTDPSICGMTIWVFIRGLVETIDLSNKPCVVLGRSDMYAGFQPDLDLTPYGGRTRGVSRAHVRLHRQGEHLYATDLSSDNGTFIGGRRLVPDVPYMLRSGDEMKLGSLNVRVLFG